MADGTAHYAEKVGDTQQLAILKWAKVIRWRGLFLCSYLLFNFSQQVLTLDHRQEKNFVKKSFKKIFFEEKVKKSFVKIVLKKPLSIKV